MFLFAVNGNVVKIRKVVCRVLQRAELLRQIYFPAPEPAFGFDRDLKVLWVNPACEEQFPRLTEGVRLTDFFPDFGLDHAAELSESRGTAIFSSGRTGGESILAGCPGGDPSVWAGVYRNYCAYEVSPGAEGSADGIRLLSYYVRQQVFKIMNQLDSLSGQVEEAGCYQASGSIARVEEGCLSLLRLSGNLTLYYQHEEPPLLRSVRAGDYFLRILQEAEFRLAAAGLRLDYAVDCGDAACLLPADRLEAGLLDMMAASARYLRDEAEENRVLTCRCTAGDGEVRLLLSDNRSVFAEVEEHSLHGGMRLDSTGEVMSVKGIGYRILEQAAADAGGSCLLENGRPGIRLLLRLPESGEPGPQVKDQPVYTPSCDPDGRFSLANILLSGLSD